MPGRECERRRIAVDLVDVVEDSWPQKRAWLQSVLDFDPGALPRSRRWIEDAVDDQGRFDGYDCYEAMCHAVNAPDSLLRRRPVRGAVRGLHRLAENAEIFLVSSRREAKRAVTRAWLAANGLDWIPRSNLLLLGIRAAAREGRSVPGKLATCAGIGVHALVDNEVSQLKRGVAEAPSITRILFSADPQEIACRPGGILVARTWAETMRLLKRRAALA